MKEVPIHCAHDELVDLEKLIPNPRNPNKHPQRQIELLAKVIEVQGWRVPITVSTRSGFVVRGHGRLAAARLLQCARAPVDFQEYANEAEEWADLIADNRIAELAETDDDLLRELMKEIDGYDLDLKLTGYEDDEILALLAGTDPNAGLTDPDDVPEAPEEAVTRVGDLWTLGGHRLLCGDSANPTDVDRLLAGASIQLVNTDPPYNVKVEPRSNNAIAAGLSSGRGLMHHQGADLARHKEKAKRTTKKLRPMDRLLMNDCVSDSEFEKLLLAWFGNMGRVLDPGRSFYVWGGFANWGNYPPAMHASGLYFAHGIVWVKDCPVLGRKDFMLDHESCFYGWKEGAGHIFVGPNNVRDVWHVKKVTNQEKVHLTEKPVELAVRAMQYSSRPGENVLDLFGGSGSTLIGAEQTGRKANLMELDPLYCDVIVERWQNFTGKKATREEDGTGFDELAHDARPSA